MIIIWRGWGILVLPITILYLVLVYLAVELLSKLLGTDLTNIPLVSSIGLGISLSLAAIPTWFLGKFFNKNGPHHALFFIPMQYWGVILAALGFISLTTGVYQLLVRSLFNSSAFPIVSITI